MLPTDLFEHEKLGKASTICMHKEIQKALSCPRKRKKWSFSGSVNIKFPIPFSAHAVFAISYLRSQLFFKTDSNSQANKVRQFQ